MKATGIVRRIDDLGRIVIPKEIRKTLKIHEGNPLEIFTDNDGNVIFKKYSPIGEMESIANLYVQTISAVLSCTCLICDTDKIIASAGVSKKEFLEKPITEKLRNFMNYRKNIQQNYNSQIIENSQKNSQLSNFVTVAGDVMGLVILLDIENSNVNFAKEYLKTISMLISKQIE